MYSTSNGEHVRDAAPIRVLAIKSSIAKRPESFAMAVKAVNPMFMSMAALRHPQCARTATSALYSPRESLVLKL